MESSISLQKFVISLEMIVFNHVIFKVNFFDFQCCSQKPAATEFYYMYIIMNMITAFFIHLQLDKILLIW